MTFSDNSYVAVFGAPVSHSMSPYVFASLTGKKIKYLRVSLESIAELKKACEVLGVKAFNLTAPFKETAMSYCDEMSDHALSAGAINTCIIRNNKILCTNTDALALYDMIENRNRNKIRKAAVIGAGGAGRSALWALQRHGIETVLMNRSEARGKASAKAFGCEFRKIGEKADLSGFDLIISAVPGLVNSLNETIKGCYCVIDSDYICGHNREVCEKSGVIYSDGWEWLLRQAVYSYEYMFGEHIGIHNLLKRKIEKKRSYFRG